ncbi:hypothetical protein BC351_00295 [Paenibacillus ferrarius]|uniref:Uncharacterized protein n=1 Tax=Paenibacillus ferrarius TaxID=1469647 RepID=A0A1V4HS74_9BACL|nr:hypothetical protein [Paenibacillus ferrarius]OPH61716.1 hypothetical protein BC351_00295 [Paenibacillus ferrarius]
MDVSNWSQLESQINKMVNNTLKNEVGTVVKNTMHDTIENVTYKEYTPSEYVRTHELSDTKNMKVKLIDANTIEITNTRHDEGVDVARIIATGIGYTWSQSRIYLMQPFERNFYEDTVEELRNTHEHIYALFKGLQRQGLNVQR